MTDTVLVRPWPGLILAEVPPQGIGLPRPLAEEWIANHLVVAVPQETPANQEAAGAARKSKRLGSDPRPQAKENQVSETKSVASETKVPEGLDVVPMEPGTVIGSRDLQGSDGTTRTDRPGEILGTPVPAPAREQARQHEADKADFITKEVDRANREELPKLGGTIDDGWEPTKASKKG